MIPELVPAHCTEDGCTDPIDLSQVGNTLCTRHLILAMLEPDPWGDTPFHEQDYDA